MKHSHDVKELAAKLRGIGVSDSYASEIANGKRTPSGRLAARIEAAIGVPASSWYSADKKARPAAASRRAQAA